MRVRLSKGKLYYYDPVSNVTLSYPTKIEAEVAADADTTQLRYAIKTKRILEVGVKKKESESSKVEDKQTVAETPEMDDSATEVPEEESSVEDTNPKPKPKPKRRGRPRKKKTDSEKDTASQEEGEK